jgi:hypothetical protein
VTLAATFQAPGAHAGSSDQTQRNLSGVVTDPTGSALVGASVAVLYQDKYMVGAACDTAGRFALSWSALNEEGSLIPDNQLRFEFSAIGFEPVTVSLPYVDSAETLRIELASVTIELSGVVSRAMHVEDDRQSRTNVEINKSAERSFLSSNPLEAVRGAEISRSGSAFGSQVRFSGSTPEHSLNGISLGVDPAHYGMFAQLPGASVARMSFTDQTQSAAAGSATAIELESSSPVLCENLCWTN